MRSGSRALIAIGLASWLGVALTGELSWAVWGGLAGFALPVLFDPRFLSETVRRMSASSQLWMLTKLAIGAAIGSLLGFAILDEARDSAALVGAIFLGLPLAIMTSLARRPKTAGKRYILLTMLTGSGVFASYAAWSMYRYRIGKTDNFVDLLLIVLGPLSCGAVTACIVGLARLAKHGASMLRCKSARANEFVGQALVPDNAAID